MKSTFKPLVATLSVLGVVSTNTVAAAEINTDEFLKGVTLSGLLQMEARYNRDYDKTDSSDFVVDELAVGIEANVHKFAKAKIVFLYEEEDTPLEIDEAILTLGNLNASPVYLAIGQMYVPFGNFESHMVSDPLTLELAETREKAAQLGFETGGFYGSVYSFNGTTRDDGNDTIDHYGANLGFAQTMGSIDYDVGVGYINDIGDTGNLGELLENVNDYDYVDGLGVHLIFQASSFRLIGEYITALDNFKTNHLAFNGSGAEPKAWNVEAGFNFNLASYQTTFALGYQASEEALALGLPETRIMGVLSTELYDNTTVSLEYAFDEDYGKSDGGTDEEADSITLQLALEF